MYTGYQKDRVANTYFAQAREYAAHEGRFTGEDVIKGNIFRPYIINHYTYCLNQPLKFLDLNGCEPVDAIVYAEAMGADVNVALEYYPHAEGKSYLYTATTITYKGRSHTFDLPNGKVDDSEINEVFGGENSWIPNGQTYQAYLGSHKVFNTPAHHSSVVVFATPDCPVFGNHSQFDNSFSNVNYATVGGGATGGIKVVGGTLIGAFNRPSDVDLAIKTEMLVMGIDAHTIHQLFGHTGNFEKSANLRYDLFPHSNFKGYNSGSFIAGLLQSLRFRLCTRTTFAWMGKTSPM